MSTYNAYASYLREIWFPYQLHYAVPFPVNSEALTNPPISSEVEDCTSEWTFAPSTFDYVHARWMTGSIADWTAFFREAYKALKPGAWFESHEPSPEIVSEDDTVTPDTALGQWSKIFHEGGKVIGRTFDPYSTGLQRRAMEEAGFVDIREVNLTVGTPDMHFFDRLYCRALGLTI